MLVNVKVAAGGAGRGWRGGGGHVVTFQQQRICGGHGRGESVRVRPVSEALPATVCAELAAAPASSSHIRCLQSLPPHHCCGWREARALIKEFYFHIGRRHATKCLKKHWNN